MCSAANLEERLAAAEAEITLFRGMLDTTRRVVSAAHLVVETDTSSPQVLTASDGGSLELGAETPMRVIGTARDQSHTGDTDLTKIATITVPADSMGANGFLRIAADWRATGAGTHTFKIQFGGNDVRRYWSAGALLMADFPPTVIRNKGATNSQESGIMWLAFTRNTESPNTMSEDTTADVDVDFLVQNTDAGAEAFLRFALVEAFYQD